MNTYFYLIPKSFYGESFYNNIGKPFKGDLDAALRELAALGLREVDLIVIEAWNHVSLERLVRDFSKECARVEGLLAKHGLRAVSVNAAFLPDLHERAETEGNEARLAQVHALAEFMQHLGIKIGAHYPGYIADWKNDEAEVWAA